MVALELDPATTPSPLVARAWRPAVPGIREVFHARFPDHAYPPHTHSAWTLFVVDDGAVRYDLERRGHVMGPSMLSILPPHVPHDGRPVTADGYAMRVLYVEPDVLGEDAIGAAVDRPITTSPRLRARVDRLHTTLACRDDALEAEEAFAGLVTEIRGALGLPASGARATLEAGGWPDRPSGDVAEAFRAHLEANLFEPVTIGRAAAALGVDATRLAREFAATFGLPPHAWVTSRRLEAARMRILDGAPLADVAAEVGFADQAHLTRRFRQWFGTTPAAIRGGRAGSASGSRGA